MYRDIHAIKLLENIVGQIYVKASFLPPDRVAIKLPLIVEEGNSIILDSYALESNVGNSPCGQKSGGFRVNVGNV